MSEEEMDSVRMFKPVNESLISLARALVAPEKDYSTISDARRDFLVSFFDRDFEKYRLHLANSARINRDGVVKGLFNSVRGGLSLIAEDISKGSVLGVEDILAGVGVLYSSLSLLQCCVENYEAEVMGRRK